MQNFFSIVMELHLQTSDKQLFLDKAFVSAILSCDLGLLIDWNKLENW